MTKVIPIILSGGAGTRLWPLSRDERPKQFLSFGGSDTLVVDTLKRCQGPLFDQRPIFVAATAHKTMLMEAASSLNVAADIILEPLRRDSCAAIVAGALLAERRAPNSLILVLAADHHIPDRQAFAQAVEQAIAAADAGWLVTFGIKPHYPATGYGYIKPGAKIAGDNVRKLDRFKEKPDLATASIYLRDGYLWNSGNFLFKAAALLAEARSHVPKVVEAVSKSLERAKRDDNAYALREEDFATSPQISFDYAVMEPTTKAAVLPVDYHWSDIGTWGAVANALDKDEDGNSIVGKGLIHSSKNVMIYSQSQLTAVLDCRDIAVITTPEAVLVTSLGSSERVKDLVADLKSREPMERARQTPRTETLATGARHLVKQISLQAGQTMQGKLAMPTSEQWTVVAGTLQITVNGTSSTLSVGQSIGLAAGTEFQASAATSEAQVIVVQTG